MDDIRFEDDKLYAEASWFLLSEIKEVAVKESIGFGRAPILLAVMVACCQWVTGWNTVYGHPFIWVMGAIVVRMMLTKYFRVSVIMDSGKYDVIKFVGVSVIGGIDRLIGFGSEFSVAQARVRALELAERIRARIPDG